MQIKDDKLPEGVTRHKISPSLHTLRCETCGLEAAFDPDIPNDIQKALRAMSFHRCQK